MLDATDGWHLLSVKRRLTLLQWEGVAGYQLVGEVMAHQGDDGYRV
jgi:hypothetical protein